MTIGEASSFPIHMAEPPRLSEILLPADKGHAGKLTASPTEV